MTWSHGYFCPNCECRWVKHLCKEHLPCGCGVKTEDAVYIYTKWYARKGMEIYIAYRDFTLDDFIPHEESDEEAIKRLYKKVESHAESALLKKAINNAIYGRSLNWRDWSARCGKCRHFTSVYHRKKCRIHDWCSIDCKDFVKKEEKDEAHFDNTGN